MIIGTIIASSVIIALVVRFLIVGKKAYEINKLLFTVCAVVLPIGTFLVITQTNVLQTHIGYLSRPIITGIVTKSEIVGSEKAFRPKITYQYVVDSMTYTKTTSMNSPMFGNKRKQHDVAKVTSELYPVGKELNVYYNPTDPSDASLAHALAWNVYGQIGFGAFLISLTLFGLMMPRKKSWL